MVCLKTRQVSSLSCVISSKSSGQKYLSTDWCLSRAHHCLQICLDPFLKQKVRICIHTENFYFLLSNAQFRFISPHVEGTMIANFSCCLTRSLPYSLLKKSSSIRKNHAGMEHTEGHSISNNCSYK